MVLFEEVAGKQKRTNLVFTTLLPYFRNCRGVPGSVGRYQFVFAHSCRAPARNLIWSLTNKRGRFSFCHCLESMGNFLPHQSCTVFYFIWSNTASKTFKVKNCKVRIVFGIWQNSSNSNQNPKIHSIWVISWCIVEFQLQKKHNLECFCWNFSFLVDTSSWLVAISYSNTWSKAICLPADKDFWQAIMLP